MATVYKTLCRPYTDQICLHLIYLTHLQHWTQQEILFSWPPSRHTSLLPKPEWFGGPDPKSHCLLNTKLSIPNNYLKIELLTNTHILASLVFLISVKVTITDSLHMAFFLISLSLKSVNTNSKIYPNSSPLEPL